MNVAAEIMRVENDLYAFEIAISWNEEFSLISLYLKAIQSFLTDKLL